jgi:hypothetical protein
MLRSSATPRDALAPIGLAELDASAALQRRVDVQYVAPSTSCRRCLSCSRRRTARRSSTDGALRALGVRPVGGRSKYRLGVALTRPGVTANPYRRLLRRHVEETA